AFAPDAGILRSAERSAEVAQEPTVNPADADVDLRRDAMRAPQIARPHGGREAVLRVVRHSHRVGLVIERLDVDARAEDLLLHDRRCFGESGPDRGLDPRALFELLAHVPNLAAGND